MVSGYKSLSQDIQIPTFDIGGLLWLECSHIYIEGRKVKDSVVVFGFGRKTDIFVDNLENILLSIEF